MELENLYKCLCDTQRLRILNLLKEGPLCVCHLQEILEESQVKTSKQLQYMKKLKMVEARRDGVWMVYSLPASAHPLLMVNLAGLAGCAGEYPFLAEDLSRRAAIMRRFAENQAECPDVVYQASNCC